MPELARGTNPYKGPYAFELKDAALFTGRDEEAETLLSLAISERIVVFCAPSGAGKSSLLNARLIPGLRRGGFKVLPVVRVGGDLPPEVNPDNVFVFNALWILAGSKADPEALKCCTLDAFLKPIARARGRKGPPRVLIFDQFEEILTTHADRWAQRKDFFLQLRQALLDDPTLSVVMSLREDHLAGLDTYAPLLPGQLRTRFRMETLRRDKAVAAARQPALAAGLPFDPDVAERLVEDLSRVRMAGHEEPVPGEFVEPVQLQVVCYQLWENLQEQSRNQPRQTITEEDRRRFGDPDQALEGFYESALRRAAEKTGLPEARIRHWCGTSLITPTRIRSQVNREPEESGGLPNPAIDSLVDSHLVRAEAARGGIWYELAHDRFVEPILRSNQRATPSEANRLAEDAQAWLKAGRHPSFLYSGLRLKEAVQSSQESGALLSAQESEFLAHSQKAEADAKVRQARRLRFVMALLVLLVIVTAASAFVASQQRRLAVARELALAATIQASQDPELSLLLALEAVEKASIQQTEVLQVEAALHEALRASVVRRTLSLPVSSPSSGAFAFSPGGKQFAAVDENGFVGIWKSDSGDPLHTSPRPAATVTSLAYGPRGLVAYGDRKGGVTFWRPGAVSAPPPPLLFGADIRALAWSPNGARLAIADGSRSVSLWNTATQSLETLPEPEAAILTLAFSRDSRFLALGGHSEGKGIVVVRDLQSGDSFTIRHQNLSPVTTVAFGLGNLLATGSQDTGLWIWDWRQGRLSQTLYGHRDWIFDVAFSQDGKYLATAGADGEARLWSLGARESLYVLSPEGGRLSRIAFSGGRMAIVSQAELGTSQFTGTLTLWNIVLDDKLLFPGQARHLAGFSPDSRSLVAVDRQGLTHRWDFSSAEGKTTPLFDSQGPAPRHVQLTSKGRLVALTGQDLLLQPTSPPGRLSKIPLRTGRQPMGHFTLSADGGLLAAAHWKTLFLLRLGAAPRPPLEFEALPQQNPVTALALSPDGTRLAIAGDQGSIEVRTTTPQETSVTFLRHSGDRSPRVSDLEISPDGRWLASAEEDRTAKLWDLNKRTLRQVFEGHASRVIAVAFSPNGKRLASADAEGEVRLWDVAEVRSLFNLSVRTSSVVEMAFSPDGRRLATLSSDGTLRLDAVALDDLIAQARRRVSRPLSDQERRIYLHED